MATTYPVNRSCPLTGEPARGILGYMRAGLVVTSNPTYRPDALAILGLDPEDAFPIAEGPSGFAFAGWLPDNAFLRRTYEDAVDHARTTSEAVWYRQFLLELAARLLEAAPAKPTLKVLDYGCGYGALLRLLTSRDVVGVGYEPTAARRAVAGNADILNDLAEVAERGPFDLLVCTEALEHMPDPAPAVRALRENAAPGAVLLVTVPGCTRDYLREALAGFAAGTAQPMMFNPWEHLSYFRPADLRALLEREGFDVVADLGRTSAARRALVADSSGLGDVTTAVRAAKRLFTAPMSTNLLCRPR
jgi:2-polyprenyl-3-methyl-5-hydroxy-6-metoxy-1,4-benzoquinol methylase